MKIFSVALITLALLESLAMNATAALTSEQQTLELAKKMKPITDVDWATIAGAKASEKYEIIKGDTLYDISKKLFGDSKYWPKIWELNNKLITNPHWIRPGNHVVFMPGSGSELPSLSLNAGTPNSAAATATGAPGAGENPTGRTSDSLKTSSGRSEDWKNLPPQSWEMVPLTLPTEVDPLGFSKKNKVSYARPKGYYLEAIAATDRIPFVGQITGSRNESRYFTTGDTVFIEADEQLQVGQSYDLTQEPFVLSNSFFSRAGYSYLISGRVKILGVKDGLFIGKITLARNIIARKAQLIPAQERTKNHDPIPGEAAIESNVLFDANFGTFESVQFKQVFLNRGTEDGVKPGMIFRVYQHRDGNTQKKLTSADFIIQADIQVVQVSEKVSSGMIIRSIRPIAEGATAVLLTDIADLTSFKEQLPTPGAKPGDAKDLDDLDSMDHGRIGKKEEKELEQLEKWKKNPPKEPQPGDLVPEAAAPVETPPPPALPDLPPELPSGPPAGSIDAPPEALPEAPKELAPAPTASPAPTLQEAPAGPAVEDAPPPEMPPELPPAPTPVSQ